MQVDDNGEEILHEMGQREKCAVVELKGNAFLFLKKLPFRHGNVNFTFGNVLGRLYAAGGLKTTITERAIGSEFDDTVDVFDLKTREACESLKMSTIRFQPCGVATETEVVIAGGCTPIAGKMTPQASIEAFSPITKRSRNQHLTNLLTWKFVRHLMSLLL